MNPPALLFAFRCLVRDTFSQARASGIFWLVLGVTAFCAALCLTAEVRDDPAALTMAFGAVRVPLQGGTQQGVRTVQAVLAVWVADSAGLLLALIWTAGFLPSFLETESVSVLLAKPMPRWLMLAGKVIGVNAFVGVLALVFVGTTWLALAVRTGVWDATYFWCVPLLLLHFAIFFSFSAMLAVSMRSTVVCIFGSVLFWLLCWGMNFGRHAILSVPELEATTAGLSHTMEVGYWLLPKPADPGLLLLDALGIDNPLSGIIDFHRIQDRDAFHPVLSILSSLGFTIVLLAISAHEFVTAEY